MTTSKRKETSKVRAKTVTKKTTATLPKPILEAVRRFIEYHPAKPFSTNLRTMLIEFLMTEGNTEATYLWHLLNDIQGLFELLDVIHEQSSTENLDLAA